MERINELIKGKELIVRKNVASFLEKILQFLGYDFRHDIYKKIVYSEKSIVTPLEEKIKNYYDAYVFLLNNYKNPITKNLLMRFFYIIFGHEFDGYTICKLVNMFFNYDDLSGIEIAIKYHIDIYKELKNYSLEERLIISLMIFNFMLLRYNIPTIKLTQKEINKYVEARDAYISGNRILIYDVILRLMNNNDKYQDITYYKNLKELSLTDIIAVFNKDKEYLKKQYKIKSLMIFGSFASGDQRIDSDIDILISFSLDLSYQKKNLFIEEIKRNYFEIFKRFIDIAEIGFNLSDELIKKFSYIKKIF